MGRSDRTRSWWKTAVAAAAMVLAACVPPGTATPTAGLSPADPGGDGGCRAMARRSVPNPAQWEYPVFIFEPTGSSPAVDGGRCDDDDRPVIVLGHGYSLGGTEGYTPFLEHLVSRGFVVVYPGYQLDFDPPSQYLGLLTGARVGLAATPRADSSRLGMVGHSWGSGASSFVLTSLVADGHGSEALWAVLFAPAFPLLVGAGPIDLPAHAQILVVNFEEDVFVDARIAAELVGSIRGPRRAPRHLLVRSDRAAAPYLVADHLVPVTFVTDSDTGFDVDHLDRWAVWRPIDAVAACSLAGRWCDTDLTDMGVEQTSGRAVRPARWMGRHDDIGPPAILECDGILRFIAQRDCA